MVIYRMYKSITDISVHRLDSDKYTKYTGIMYSSEFNLFVQKY